MPQMTEILSSIALLAKCLALKTAGYCENRIARRKLTLEPDAYSSSSRKALSPIASGQTVEISPATIVSVTPVAIPAGLPRN
jgi:hypothetical protein